jgi:hypothetical protein
MRPQKSTNSTSGLLALLLLALLAAGLTACGVGPAGDEEKISQTATAYLRALADGDTAEACAQLTRAAKGDGCEAAIKERLSRLDSDARLPIGLLPPLLAPRVGRSSGRDGALKVPSDEQPTPKQTSMMWRSPTTQQRHRALDAPRHQIGVRRLAVRESR